MAGEAIGHGANVAFLRNTNAWGTLAMAAGALHGVDVDQIGIKVASEIIELMGVIGKKTQQPPVKGSEMGSGPIGPMDLYYDGCARFLAYVMGTSVPPVLTGGGAATYLSVYKMADSHKGIYGTLVEKSGAAIREFPFVKLSGFTLECESGKAAKLTPDAFVDTVNYNQGVPAAASIVASIAPANNPAFTIIGGAPFVPAEPTPVRLTYTVGTGSVTAWTVTITGLDQHGDVIVATYNKATDGVLWDSKEYFTSVISVAGNTPTGTVGTDVFTVGVSNGKNNDTSVASITYPADRNMVVFPQMKLYTNDQGGAALDSSVVKNIKKISLRVALNLRQSVTTARRRLIDEPLSDGFASVELGITFERWSTVTGAELNHDLEKARMKKSAKKVLLEWKGPITEAALQYRLSCYLNNMVFTDGGPQFSGPGQFPFDLTGRAYLASTLPTGFPAGYLDPLTIELVNKNSVDAIT